MTVEFESLLPMRVHERPLDLTAPGWIYEIKLDGYRLMAEFGAGRAGRLKTKNGADATRWFPEITQALGTIKTGPHIVDGEVVVLDDLGRTDFDKLHARALRRRWVSGASMVVYCVFDILVHDGENVMDQPLLDRKALLASVFSPPPDRLLVVGHFDSDADRIFKEAVLGLQLEGLVAKREGSPYIPNTRSPDWVKVKRKGHIAPGRFSRRP